MSGRQISIVRTPDRALIPPSIPALLVFIGVTLLFSGSVLVLSVLNGMQLGRNLIHPNPLTPYEGVWPGQSIRSLAEYVHRMADGSITCRSSTLPSENYSSLEISSNFPDSNDYNSSSSLLCMTDSQDDFFRSMRVTLVDNRVRELILFSDLLDQDTLVYYWGTPDSINGSLSDKWISLYWNRDTYTAVAMVTKYNLTVKLLRLTAK